MKLFRIREAKPDDVDAIRVVHRRSVLDLAIDTYPADVISGWKPNPEPKSIAHHQESIRSGSELVWVAEISGKIEGFSVLVPTENELRACYVTGVVARKGVGTALLQVLEKRAHELGLKKLKLSSSINARPFYEKHGYVELSKGQHTLQTGVKIDCIFMEKHLDGGDHCKVDEPVTLQATTKIESL